ncbi:Zinc finger, RING-type [Corchorus capsularis]|uniref:RING-type E3 ubiquitin transferase n=1 Tax=Corchorus capsularis TaxID=210143 RepID=A0A1R3GRJ1_COCAP|nr:Zinc finger, RING-type [Corchorus capsularis]
MAYPIPSSDHRLHSGSGIVHCIISTVEDVAPEPNEPPPLFHQVKLTISSRIHLIRHYCLSDVVTGDRLLYPPETFRFESDLFKDNKEVVSLLLSYILKSNDLFDDYSDLDQIVNDIMGRGLEFSESLTSVAADKEPEVLHLVAELDEIVEERIDYESEWDLSLERAVEESELELEACNYGMVPAEEASVKEMLKKVDKAESGDCMICLEEFKAEISDALEMPCSHAFHGGCIQTWLKQSHYCPVCRFEMPIVMN